MRIVLQRVEEARVEVDETVAGKIQWGFLGLVGFGDGDDEAMIGGRVWNGMIDKMLGLRVFADERNKMNRSIVDAGGDLLLVSQFTLYADCRKGRRPSFQKSAPAETAEILYNRLCDDTAEKFNGRVERGVFGANMRVALINAGPVTIVLDDKELFGDDGSI